MRMEFRTSVFGMMQIKINGTWVNIDIRDTGTGEKRLVIDIPNGCIYSTNREKYHDVLIDNSIKEKELVIIIPKGE